MKNPYSKFFIAYIDLFFNNRTVPPISRSLTSLVITSSITSLKSNEITYAMPTFLRKFIIHSQSRPKQYLLHASRRTYCMFYQKIFQQLMRSNFICPIIEDFFQTCFLPNYCQPTTTQIILEQTLCSM